MRHGKPTVNAQQWISGYEIPRFVSQYQAAKVSNDSLPSEELRLLIQSAKAVFTNDLPRSIHSAQILEPYIAVLNDL